MSYGPGPSRPPGLAPERPALPQRGRRRRRPSTIAQRRRRLVVALGALVVLALIIVSGLGGGLPQPPAPSVADSAGPGDPFAYRSSQEADFVARATAGDA
ncbi:MAG: hypothetical protein ACXVSE_07275, partial [Solirubrobacteraceae bacterium]